MSKIVLTDLTNSSDSFIQDLTEDELNILGGINWGKFVAGCKQVVHGVVAIYHSVVD